VVRVIHQVLLVVSVIHQVSLVVRVIHQVSLVGSCDSPGVASWFVRFTRCC